MAHPVVETAVCHVREHHADVLTAISDAASDAAADWPPGGTPDGKRVRADFRAELADSGVLADLPGVLTAAVDATGASLRASPVAAPPYVVVTSTGVLLRATLDPGRLVLELAAFERASDRYRPRDAVAVSGALK